MFMFTRRLSWTAPLVFQAALIGSGDVRGGEAADDVLFIRDDGPEDVELVLVQADESAGEEKAVQKAKAKASQAAEQAAQEVAKAKESVARAKEAQEKAKESAIRAVKGGQIRIVSPDGKTFEIIAPHAGVDVLRENVRHLHKGQDESGNKAFTIIRSAKGEHPIESDDIQKLIGKLTASAKDHVAETPRFVIGVSVSKAPEVVLAQLGRPEEKAVVVESVVDDSPAEKAGVQKLDLILKAGDEPVGSPAELTRAVKAADGKEIKLTLVRAGKDLTLSLTPKPNEPADVRPVTTDGIIEFGPAMMERRLMLGDPGLPPGALLSEIKAMRKDFEELKKLVEELKPAK